MKKLMEMEIKKQYPESGYCTVWEEVGEFYAHFENGGRWETISAWQIGL